MNQDAITAQDGGATRREFIKKSTLAAAAAASVNIFKTPVYGQNTAPSTGRVIGANDRIRVGYIGTWHQGQYHVSTQKDAAAANNIEQVAVCDLSKQCQTDAAAIIGPQCATYKDYEELLARKDIDAVTIATVDHWHCKTTLAALDAGKHIYVEKPMTRYLAEAYEVVDKVKATGKIVQVGSQGCSAEGWKRASELIKKGDIGTVVWAQGYYCRNSLSGEWNLDIPAWCANPASGTIDWDKWQAPVHDKIPFDAERYMHWRKYYPYCAGMLGDLVPHRLLPLMLATGNSEFPTRVASLGTKNVHADTADKNKLWPERDCPEHLEILVEFPSGMTLVIVTSTVNARSPDFAIYGHKATLQIGVLGERIKLLPEEKFSEDIDLQTIDGLSPENIPAHEKNWFDCIRSGNQPNANVDLALRAQAVVSLAEMSNRMNMMCLYDAKTRMIKTSDGKEIPPITYGTLEPS